jgi:hypothetical protein
MTRINAVCLVLVLAVLFACGGGGQRSGDSGKGASPEKKRYSRADFQGLVLGKTQEQVKQSLGDPDLAFQHNRDSGGTAWRYDAITYTPPSKNSDRYVIIYWFTHYDRRSRFGPDGKAIAGWKPDPDDGKLVPDARLVEYSDGSLGG